MSFPPPKKKPGIGLLIGIGPAGRDSGPPMPKKYSTPGTEQGPPPRPNHQEPDQDEKPMAGRGGGAGGGVQIGPEDVEYKSGDLCGKCAHMGGDGMCMKYQFPVDEEGHCEAGFEPAGGQGQGGPGEMEPDQDDMSNGGGAGAWRG